MSTEKLSKKLVWAMGAAITGAIFAGSSAQAATTTQADSWSADLEGTVTLAQDAGNVSVTFPGGFPETAKAELIANSTSGDLHGNLSAAGASAISFQADVTGSVDPGTRAVIVSATGRTWYRSVAAGGAVSIPLNSTAWTLEYGVGTQEKWDADLADVLAIGVVVNRGEPSAPATYAISGFALTSESPVGGSGLSDLESALQARFGVTSLADIDPEDAAADSDGDGMSDLNEILAENEPGYFATKLFLADIVEVDGASVTIKWACAAGNDYSVLRADSASGDFTVIAGPTTAAETGFQTFVDAAGGDNAFYLIQQDSE
ncbi:MAG: hypothetical protein O3A51_03645 [Verrucomicrobia bacterium]|nr:hypothetical protein [Verrucomicrobiota bacterium]